MPSFVRGVDCDACAAVEVFPALFSPAVTTPEVSQPYFRLKKYPHSHDDTVPKSADKASPRGFRRTTTRNALRIEVMSTENLPGFYEMRRLKLSAFPVVY